MSPKGRPTSDPKTVDTHIRLSEADQRRLEYCAKETGLTKSNVIRLGIKEIYDRLTKK